MTRKTRYFMLVSGFTLVVGLCTGLLAYYGGLPTLASGREKAGPTELSYVPPTAAVVAYANVRDVMSSDFRQKLRQVLPGHDQKGQEEFQRETGINIEQDIDYVLAWMSPGSGTNAGSAGRHGPFHDGSGMALLRGRFDQARLESLATAHGAKPETVGRVRLFSIDKHDGRDAAVAFLEPGLIAMGDDATVRGAIASKAAGTSIRANEDLMNLIADLEGSSNLWAVGRMDAVANQAHLPEQIASQIPAVKWFSASSQINGGLSGMLRAEARDDEAAKNLRDVVQGFMALAKLQAGSKPELQPLLQSIQLSGTGKTVALSFEVPADLIDPMSQKKKRVED
jgi:hypothetical protein